MMGVKAVAIVCLVGVVVVAGAKIWDGKMAWGGGKKWGGGLVWEAEERTAPPPSSRPSPPHLILKEHVMDTLKEISEAAKENADQESEAASQDDQNIGDESANPPIGMLRMKDLVLALTSVLEKGWQEGQEEDVSKFAAAMVPPALLAREEEDSLPPQ